MRETLVVSQQSGYSFRSGMKENSFSICKNACSGKICSFGGDIYKSLSVRTGWTNSRAKTFSTFRSLHNLALYIVVLGVLWHF